MVSALLWSAELSAVVLYGYRRVGCHYRGEGGLRSGAMGGGGEGKILSAVHLVVVVVVQDAQREGGCGGSSSGCGGGWSGETAGATAARCVRSWTRERSIGNPGARSCRCSGMLSLLLLRGMSSVIVDG